MRDFELTKPTDESDPMVFFQMLRWVCNPLAFFVFCFKKKNFQFFKVNVLAYQESHPRKTIPKFRPSFKKNHLC